MSDTIKKKRPLTIREKEVLICIADGLRNSEIATKLGIKCRTVEKFREHIEGKLDISGAAQLTRYAVLHGMVQLPPPINLIISRPRKLSSETRKKTRVVCV